MLAFFQFQGIGDVNDDDTVEELNLLAIGLVEQTKVAFLRFVFVCQQEEQTNAENFDDDGNPPTTADDVTCECNTDHGQCTDAGKA